METPELSARLRYLNESAHLLATSAPATSKYLMSHHNSLLFDNNIDLPEAQRRKACGGCGTIMNPGRETTVEVERSPRKGGKYNINATKVMVYTCCCCGAKTRQAIPPAPKPLRVKSGLLKTPSISTASSAALQTKPTSPARESSNSSSKKRANRKQGGLKALLAKQKASQSTPSSGFGLDLMDFMSKG